MSDKEPITMMEAPIYLDYNFKASAAAAHFLEGLKEGKLIGMRTAHSDNVYVPPRGSCPRFGEELTVPTEVDDTGFVKSFTIVHIPIPGNPIKPPFIVANIHLDGAALSLIHLVSGVPNEEVRIGMRVKAKWRPKSEWSSSMENISYFEPLDEPDVDVDALQAAVKEKYNA